MNVCAGHICDECRMCTGSQTTKAHCCRGDNPDYRLPKTGEWEPYYGRLGVMNEAGDEQECHACGGWFQAIGYHIWRKHDLNADEYRALFGLRRTEPLAGLAVRERTRQRLRPWAGQNVEANLAKMNGITPERRAMLAARPGRLQHRGRVLRRCLECGREFWTITKNVRHHGANYCSMSCASKSRRGIRASNRKHSPELVAEIRQRYARGDISQSQLANDYGLTQPRVSEMVIGKNWMVPEAGMDAVVEPKLPVRRNSEAQREARRLYKARRRAEGKPA